MYLSKVQLDWSASRNPYEWHRALWQLFPNRPDDARDFLFRMEQLQAGKGAVLLLQSAIPPLESIANASLIAPTKMLNLSKLSTGQALRFRLTANVIKTIRDQKNPEKRVRVPLVREDEQQAWLARKLEGAATLDEVTLQKNAPLLFRRGGSAGKLVTVTFDGILTVTNPEVFRNLVANGIGAAKSFGCGLLTMART
ncbi:type I-E CRISPR-associated protein Cas6/Cse3/CasE [Candidatus Nitrotoga sp. AM1P]|uniref:type I-E CRISPR-associated protein Cas6/Cse3/CasE n=1 Tax=Candidatus Nitrotoga sp. AM1P TaxID=2559597 RepID=UPI0010B35633|nr:type I-E CRISPR-associated protein Cas6/Cse3/CasE [Candidatus Nitrotoga sp. AM1P]BBJ22999.1 type I-E CRISPR-associated protein CasE [Candidatus Nitrotoga sp. AM1P]